MVADNVRALQVTWSSKEKEFVYGSFVMTLELIVTNLIEDLMVLDPPSQEPIQRLAINLATSAVSYCENVEKDEKSASKNFKTAILELLRVVKEATNE
jgi:hypothetical protein